MKVPEGGWTAQTFREHGAMLITELVASASRVKRQSGSLIGRAAAKVFQRQADDLVRIARSRIGFRRVETAPLNLESQLALWMGALDQVAKEFPVETIKELLPEIQRSMKLGYDKTGALLGNKVRDVADDTILIRSDKIAKRITSISETTRDKFRTVITRELEDGTPPAALAEKLRSEFVDFNRARLNTIARTESMMAWNEGSVTAFQESTTILEVDVIGCMAREKGSPTYRGESTCNIAGVPVEDCHLLDFHPNHTGTMVPSKFKSGN